MGGYRPRRRVDGGELDPVAVALANQASYVDPMMAMRGPGAAVIDPSLPPEERTNTGGGAVPSSCCGQALAVGVTGLIVASCLCGRVDSCQLLV